MPTYNWSAIFLGTAADADPDDANSTMENAGDLLGSYGSVADPLRNHIVDVVANDDDDDTNLNYDDPAETFNVDGVDHTADSGAVFNATITYVDGTTASITAVILQTTDGGLYLLPEMSNNADLAAMEAGPIRALTLDSVSTDTTTIGANRQQTNFVCFTDDTLIRTPYGDRPIVDLAAGDPVLTLDHGHQPVRWIGKRRRSVIQQMLHPASRPLLIPPDSFLPGKPASTLSLSRQHRVLVKNRLAERMFAEDEVLIAALHLDRVFGVHTAQEVRPVTYYHIAFDRHEVILANGLPCESLFPGPETSRLLGRERLAEIGQFSRLFESRPNAARPLATGARAHQFMRRLEKRSARHPACRSMVHPVSSGVSPAW